MFAAESDGEIIGFISLEDDGENFIIEHEKMKNICGAYFDERYRSCGLAQSLLGYIRDTLSDEDVTHLGVDLKLLILQHLISGASILSHLHFPLQEELMKEFVVKIK